MTHITYNLNAANLNLRNARLAAEKMNLKVIEIVLAQEEIDGQLAFEHGYRLTYVPYMKAQGAWQIRFWDEESGTLEGVQDCTNRAEALNSLKTRIEGSWNRNGKDLPPHIQKVADYLKQEEQKASPKKKASAEKTRNEVPLKTLLADPSKAKLARRKLRASEYNPTHGRWAFPPEQVEAIRSYLGSLAS